MLLPDEGVYTSIYTRFHKELSIRVFHGKATSSPQWLVRRKAEFRNAPGNQLTLCKRFHMGAENGNSGYTPCMLNMKLPPQKQLRSGSPTKFQIPHNFIFALLNRLLCFCLGFLRTRILTPEILNHGKKQISASLTRAPRVPYKFFSI